MGCSKPHKCWGSQTHNIYYCGKEAAESRYLTGLSSFFEANYCACENSSKPTISSQERRRATLRETAETRGWGEPEGREASSGRALRRRQALGRPACGMGARPPAERGLALLARRASRFGLGSGLGSGLGPVPPGGGAGAAGIAGRGALPPPRVPVIVPK